MRKIFKAGICTMAAVMLLTGCAGKTDKETTAASEAESTGTQAAETAETEAYVAEGSLTLGEYKGIPVNVTKADVTEEEVEAQIKQMLDSNPEYITVDRAAKDGDTVDINFKGLVDGVAFEGGTAENYQLVLGSKNFIEGFEAGLVGAKKGEQKSLNLTFPAEYQSPDLAGKAVVFEVTVNGVQEEKIPQLNDEFVMKVSPEDKTVENFRKSLKEDILRQKTVQNESQRNFAILDAIMAASEVVCATKDIDTMYDEQLQMYTSQAAMYGMDFASFASIYGLDEAGFQSEIRMMATDGVKQKMIFDEIAKKEALAVTDEDRAKLAEVNGFESAAKLIEAYSEKEVEEAALSQKVMDFLVANAKITMVDAPAVTESTGESAAQ